MTDELKDAIAGSAKNVKMIGIGLIVLGILALALPQVMGKTLSVLVGILLLTGGVLRTIFAFMSPSWGATFLRVLLGILAIVAGAMMIFDPALGLQAITIVAIIYFIADGVGEILFAFTLSPASGGAWVMISGIVSLVLGIMIWRNWPISGDNAVGILVGIKLILDGIVLSIVAHFTQSAGKAVASS